MRKLNITEGRSESSTQIFISKLLFSTVVLIIAGLIPACNSGPKTQDITLSYLVKDDVMHYQRIGGAILIGVNPKMQVSVTITNTSDYGGVFKFYAKLSSQGNSIEFNEEKYIKSGETVTLTQEKEINPYSFESNVNVDSWEIIAPTKTIQIHN